MNASRHLASELPECPEAISRTPDGAAQVPQVLAANDLTSESPYALIGAAIVQGVFGTPGPMPAQVVRR